MKFVELNFTLTLTLNQQVVECFLVKMDSNETLFSLELAVEALRVHSATIVCRLPSVAFRLLDFPTLLLHHVDPQEVKYIREKIMMDTFGDIPSQLQELKDHRGNFRINKCKSSLFKMSPKMLLSHLRNTPLYIMLIDVWPEVPKLVANCTISLQRTMEEISQDIEQNGVDLPSVHGNRDSYKIYNLMGSEVGWIVVRYRLLSMGGNLIPHIPQTVITKRGSESVDLAVTPRKRKDDAVIDTKTANKEKDVVLEDLEVAGHTKTISVAVSTVDDPNFTHRTEHLEQKQQGTQTVKTSKRHKKTFGGLIPLIQNDDLVINNTHCPPPLFFNTANEDVPVSSGQYLQIVRGDHRGEEDILKNRKSETDSENLNDDLTTSSSQTLSEDIIHQIEMHYILPPGDQDVSPSWSVRKTHRTLRTEKPRVERTEKQQLAKEERKDTDLPQRARLQRSDVCTKCQLQLDPTQRTQLPILAALLQELTLLHGNALQNESVTSPRTPTQLPKPPVSTVPHSAKKKHLPLPEEKENVHSNRPKEISQTKLYRHKHRECAKPHQGVPPTKGWLRQQQPIPNSRRRPKLQYAMTRSQKLRLRKNNPELLREMEMQESRMRAYKEKERAMKMSNRPRDEDDIIETVSEHNVSTEITRHFDREEQPDYSHRLIESSRGSGGGKSSQKKVESKTTTVDTEYSEQKNSEIPSPEQPPMPAPRRPKGATFVWGDAAAFHSVAEAGYGQGASDGKAPAIIETEVSNYSHSRGRRESRESVEQKDVSSSEKSARSIDVYLPSASPHEPGSESESDDSTDDSADSQFSSSSLVNRPKTIQIPGLPSEEDLSQTGLDQTDDQSNVQYSDDFVNSDNLASTGERELGQLVSNQSDSYHSAQSSLSDDSRSSVRTTKSQTSQVAVTSPVRRPSDKPGNLQVRRLSIPKPKLSSISPVPVRRTSKTSTVSVNTAVVTPDTLKDTERSPTPPTPKPRPSLLRSASSFSETSLLRSTIPSSEFKTDDSLIVEQSADKEDSEDSYSDDFNNSDAVSDHSDTF